MNNIKTKILWYWISWGLIFITVLSKTLLAQHSISFSGIIICLLYWVFIIVVYIKEYNGLRDAVLRRFPNVYDEIFNKSQGYKDKFVKLDNWGVNPITREMYDEDLNIKNRILKLNELDFFKNIVFVCVIIIFVMTAIKFR